MSGVDDVLTMGQWKSGENIMPEAESLKGVFSALRVFYNTYYRKIAVIESLRGSQGSVACARKTETVASYHIKSEVMTDIKDKP